MERGFGTLQAISEALAGMNSADAGQAHAAYFSGCPSRAQPSGPSPARQETASVTRRRDGITIIVPTYENWPLLYRTLASVLFDARRTGVPWQVIVVDNDSGPGLVDRVQALARPGEDVEAIRRTGLGGRHFQPGAARNLGIQHAAFDCLVFLDADCVPSRGLLRRFYELSSAQPGSVFIGHRVFVDAVGLDPDQVARDRRLIGVAPRVASQANYGEVEDRRLGELRRLDSHIRPYDCLFGCNFALHRDALGDLRFDPIYDGHWGYEDIDLGYRLHQRGCRFVYVAEAFVYHQEGEAATRTDRTHQRRRNIAALEQRIPGFIAYRLGTQRPGSSPRHIL
jgi:GT2 family glycosyltransferase